MRVAKSWGSQKIGRMTFLKSDQSENEFLTASFTEKEIQDAMFDMEHNKAPSPDGFPAEFFSNFGMSSKT